ncbi:DUF664 domain-containing protein [Nocardioides antri]|uniref:DUF664 domain-containing protein n=2 Tax=Nocardioides antri TaxID=2607659 RepID=A0A5B1M1Y5_9ACTN|nr:DUF664 domain-containing protein [Nocardioides antri]
MARNSEEPPKSGPAGAARWADYLDWIRSEMIRGVLGLTPEQQRTSLVPSGWTPVELLSHVLHMEQRWFVWGFLGEPVADPWGDWDIEEPWRDGVEGRWQVADGVSAEELADRLEAIGARTREVLASYPLDALSSQGGRFAADPPSLEWICFHVLAEYARHAGHLDIVVELGG